MRNEKYLDTVYSAQKVEMRGQQVPGTVIHPPDHSPY